jgi:hypothetical protein
MFDYLKFSLSFTFLHILSYVIAGIVAYYIVHKGPYFTGDDSFFEIYRTPGTEDWNHVNKWLIPTQVIRGLLFSIVLYPVLSTIGNLGLPWSSCSFLDLCTSIRNLEAWWPDLATWRGGFTLKKRSSPKVDHFA